MIDAMIDVVADECLEAVVATAKRYVEAILD